MSFPLVTNVDRDWALAQRPPWARLSDDDEDAGEIVDDDGWLEAQRKTKQRGPTWFDFVIGEIESFELYFSGQQKTYSEWSSLWRNGWWPKRREDWKFKMAKKAFHPFFRMGTKEFSRALGLANADEKRMWLRFGIAQFKPDDPRPKIISPSGAGLTPPSKRMTGDAA